MTVLVFVTVDGGAVVGVSVGVTVTVLGGGGVPVSVGDAVSVSVMVCGPWVMTVVPPV